MPDRDTLLSSLAKTIADYRAGEIPRRDEAVIDRWLQHFPPEAQLPLLGELDHVLKRSYVPKSAVVAFLNGLLTSAKLAGEDPKKFWSETQFLEIQEHGNSQHDMLALVDAELHREFALDRAHCGGKHPARFLYIDDFLYSGGRIRGDIRRWIEQDAPRAVELHIVTMGIHRSGFWYANNQILAWANAAGKELKLTWWRTSVIDDRKNHTDSCDVLRPTQIPPIPALQAYLADKLCAADLRKPGDAGPMDLYTSDKGKILLEQQFLTAGFDVLEQCAYLRAKEQMRPMGSSFFGAGFGSPFVTYRNCANNTPLVFWAGDPWYPLFPRKTN